MRKLFLLSAVLFFANQFLFAQLTATITSYTNVSCNGVCDGTATIEASGGLSPYTYLWDAATGDQTMASATNLCAGVYTVTVTDANTATATASVTITEAPTIQINITSQTNVTCNGSCNGSVSISVTGGISPYTIQWTNGNSGLNATNLCAGVYGVTATDANGCHATANVTITEPAPIVISSSVQNSICGQSNGAIDLMVSGGCPPYSYTWSNMNTSQNLTNIPSGVYCVTITDGCGCHNTACINVVDNDGPVAYIYSQVNVSCFDGSDGNASATVTGGIQPYTYIWDANSGYQTTATATNLTTGIHCVSITDYNGCTATACATITQPAQLTLTVTSQNVSCNGYCDGQATTTVTGGTPPYSYTWNTPDYQTTATATNLCAGNYYLTMTDSHSCWKAGGTSITEPAGIEFSNTITDATCNEANGSATISVTNGISPISYLWYDVPQETSNAADSLSAGFYLVNISDSTGCFKLDTIIINNTGAPVIQTVSQTNASCNGLNDGSLVLSATGGSSPYSIDWSHDSLLTSFTANNLQAGNYIVTVTDFTGCLSFQNFSITQPGSLFLYVNITPSNCGTPGTATAYGYGGTSPYSYLWDNAATTQSVNLSAGYHEITVTDANGCAKTGNVHIGQWCINLIKGKLFVDQNSNCLPDAGESVLSNVLLRMFPSGNYASTNIYGEYQFMADTGTYTIEVLPNISPLYSLSCPSGSSTITVTCPQMGDTLDGNNFGFDYDSTGIDLQVYLSSGTARPGFDFGYYIHYKYYGIDTINATITLNHDSILTYNFSNPAETNYTYPELSWDITLAPNAYGYLNANFIVPTIGNGGYLGRVLHTSATIEPFTNDVNAVNNTTFYNTTIVGSWDPNEKEVFPIGYGTENQILPEDSLLTYTIRFQNTGTDTAFTVVLADTLSPFVDPATVISGASSHPYEFELSGSGILKWTFNHILLVDSTTNEPQSHGFVTYTVKLKPDVPFGSSIENKADIYFDFNPAVTTNTARNTLVEVLAVQTIKQPGNNDEMEVFPNPFSDKATVKVNSKSGILYETLEIYNIVGMKIKTCNPANGRNEFTLLKENLKPGVYFIKANSGNSAFVTGKMIVE